jgi:hypothetical protein
MIYFTTIASLSGRALGLPRCPINPKSKVDATFHGLPWVKYIRGKKIKVI